MLIGCVEIAEQVIAVLHISFGWDSVLDDWWFLFFFNVNS